MALQYLNKGPPTHTDNMCVSHTADTGGGREKKEKSGLIPELRQMFVVISGDFLVFLLQQEKEEKERMKERKKEKKTHTHTHTHTQTVG